MTNWQDKFLDALGPLSWGFETGDDGTLITLALEEAESLLRDRAKFRDIEGDLVDILKKFDVSAEDLEMLSRLQEIAEAGSYGDGLSSEGAQEVSNIGYEVAVLLERFADKHCVRRKAKASGKPMSKKKVQTKPKARNKGGSK